MALLQTEVLAVNTSQWFCGVGYLDFSGIKSHKPCGPKNV